ncbi:MAG: hypothetical protein MR782_06560 [Campylobacter sp.]|nr:hypothetical protein [Campylobacter sp.]
MNEKLLTAAQIGGILGLERKKIPSLYFRLAQMGIKRQSKDGVAAYPVSHDDIEKLREIYRGNTPQCQSNTTNGRWVYVDDIASELNMHPSTLGNYLRVYCKNHRMVGRRKAYFLTPEIEAKIETKCIKQLPFKQKNKIKVIQDNFSLMFQKERDENTALQQKICDLEYENSRLKERIAELESAKNVEVCVKNESELDKQIKLKQLEIFQKVLG